MRCPLKDAAIDAPNAVAIIEKGCEISYRMLDQMADSIRLDDSRCIVNEQPSVHLIAKLFAALRQNIPFCPLNLKLPRQALESYRKRLVNAPFAQILLFTSGSSAAPKLARLSLHNLLTSARAVIDAVNLKPEDRWHLSLPLYHVGGLGIIFRSVLARAGVVLDAFSPAITHLSYVPTQLYRAWPIYPTLKCVLLGGAPIFSTPSKLPIIATYGLTEMSSAVLASQPHWQGNRLYLGNPLPHAEMRLIDQEIFVRGESLFLGYENKAQSDWFATGDLALFDPNFGYSIIGRKDNMFISGGENIQPEEIEKTLLEDPNILEAVVVPKQDAEYGNRPVVFLKTLTPISLSYIQNLLADRFPKYKIPIACYPLISDHLKVNRKSLYALCNCSGS